MFSWVLHITVTILCYNMDYDFMRLGSPVRAPYHLPKREDIHMATPNSKKALSQGKSPASASKKTRRIITVVIIVTVAVALVGGALAILFANGVFGSRDAYKKLAQDRKVVATCNGFEIPYEELRFLVTLYKNSLALSYGDDIWNDPSTAEQHREELEALVMENLNKNYLSLSACRYLSIKTDDPLVEEYVDKQMEDMLKKDYKGDKKKMIADLEAEGMTEHYMRFCIGVSYLESAIHYTLLDAGLYAYSTENLADFIEYVMESGNYVRTIHYFVRNDEGDNVEANRANAQSVVDSVREVSTYNERISRMRAWLTYSEDTGLTSYNGNYFTYGEMDEAYETAAFALHSTEVSDVVEVSNGFMVIMRLDPELEYVSANYQTLLNNYQSVAMGTYIDGFEDDCPIVWNEYGKSLDFLYLE